MIDLRNQFNYVEWRPLPHSFSIPIGSDWADKADDDPTLGLYKRCGLWTMDEANLLYECARRMAVYQRIALDIGAHTSWTTAHIAAGGMDVVAIDPMLRLQEFQARFEQNMDAFWNRVLHVSHETSDEYFKGFSELSSRVGTKFGLVCIDGDHSPGFPLRDAQNAARHLTDTGVILMHDALGEPVQAAANWLMDHGFKCRVYLSVHCVLVCYRGDFTSPDFEVDPRVAAQNLPARMDDLNWGKVENKLELRTAG